MAHIGEASLGCSAACIFMGILIWQCMATVIVSLGSTQKHLHKNPPRCTFLYSIHPFIRLKRVLTFGEWPDKSFWRGRSGKKMIKKNPTFSPFQMPQENVKEIALLEITKKFKTKLSSVTPLANSPWHTAPLSLPLLLPMRKPTPGLPKKGLKNSPWKAIHERK